MTFAGSVATPATCAIKTAAMASYSAVPSMLMVAPTGSMKRVTLASYPRFFSKHCIVTGNVAELESKREREKIENCKQIKLHEYTHE